jgi:hypothetical protein
MEPHYDRNIKTIFSGLALTALFSMFCCTLCDTYIDFPQSAQLQKVNFLRLSSVKPSYGGKVDSGLSNSGNYEISISHLK